METVTIPPKIEQALAKGYEHAARATSASSPEELAKETSQAVACLKPIAPSEFCVPRASFGLGLLAEHMAKTVLGNANPEKTEEALAIAFQYFKKAEEYYGIAAGMPDYQQDMTPARAKNSLADLYHLGCLGEKDRLRAFALWKSAAQDGFAEAQINLAKCYYNGWGTEPSLQKAHLWMHAAWDNREQLLQNLQESVAPMLEQLTSELRKGVTLTVSRSRSDKPNP